jgi:hypothetical protein
LYPTVLMGLHLLCCLFCVSCSLLTVLYAQVAKALRDADLLDRLQADFVCLLCCLFCVSCSLLTVLYAQVAKALRDADLLDRLQAELNEMKGIPPHTPATTKMSNMANNAASNVAGAASNVAGAASNVAGGWAQGVSKAALAVGEAGVWRHVCVCIVLQVCYKAEAGSTLYLAALHCHALSASSKHYTFRLLQQQQQQQQQQLNGQASYPTMLLLLDCCYSCCFCRPPWVWQEEGLRRRGPAVRSRGQRQRHRGD